MKLIRFAALPLLLLAGCTSQKPQTRHATPSISLTKARRGFKTVLVPGHSAKLPAEVPPANIFRTVKYPAPNGALAAYLSVDPRDGEKHPAIIWITGGDCNSIGDVWSPAPRANDQTAAVYRQAGIVTMYPSLRGGNDNPGVKEGFLGEVDDILAAAKFLKHQAYVDPHRIYLGGHSTGGTMALLVAESSAQFRAVFAFGPIDDVTHYGANSGFLPFDITDPKEVQVRSPIEWLASIHSPVWVIEGTSGNITAFRAMQASSTNSKVQFVAVSGADHFSVLAPANDLIAKKILQDTGATCNLAFSADEVRLNAP